MNIKSIELWEEKKMGEVVKLHYGKGLPERNRVRGNIPVYGSSGICGWHNKKLIDGPSIIVGRKGSVGTVYLEIGPSYPIDTVYYVLPDDKKYNLLFLYYLLKISNLDKLNSDAAVPGLNREHAYSQLLVFPTEIDIQTKIGGILANLDELIQMNNRRIGMFEEIAKLLYREWFVEFRFPGFENIKFIDSEFGKIPESWEIIPLTKQKLFRKTFVKVSSFEGEKQYYQTSEIDGLNIVGNGEVVTYHDRPSRAGVEPLLNAIYLARMKESNKVLYFREVNQEIAESILLSTGMFGYQTTEKYFGYLFSFLNSYYFKSQKDLYATGATQVSLTDENLGKIKIILPNEDLLERYSEIINPMLDQILFLQMQNKTLESIRDLILPKLMSGEIDVSKLDININEE